MTALLDSLFLLEYTGKAKADDLIFKLNAVNILVF